MHTFFPLNGGFRTLAYPNQTIRNRPVLPIEPPFWGAPEVAIWGGLAVAWKRSFNG
ncbi:MAG: hypothetical protein O9286_14815 [Aquidulcibacter sp.]|uniref:hypothetical protein n=1 Tax=Aquidulcibacter sp. TaxID=2052990 RepID=UPI0022BD6E17|nr:hypothetical protein [Aquidulcibacter sp.]